MCEGVHGRARAGRVLVIEDEPGIAQGLRAFFLSRGFEVDLVVGDRDALRRAAAHRYSVIVADFELALRAGPEAVRELRQRDPQLPVLGMTVRNGRWLSRAAEKLGLDACFEKPFDPEELLQAVAGARSRRA